MLRRVKSIIGFTVFGPQKELGHVHDVLFNHQDWTIRYLEVDTRRWLPGRRTLISPLAVREADWGKEKFATGLDKEKIEKSPEVPLDVPLQRREEIDLMEYYQWPLYWNTGATFLSEHNYDVARKISLEEQEKILRDGDKDRKHSFLCGAGELFGCHIQARGGKSGQVKDAVFDDESWKLRHVIGHSLLGEKINKKFLLPLSLVFNLDKNENCIFTSLTRKSLEKAPEVKETQELTPALEEQVLKYYSSVQPEGFRS